MTNFFEILHFKFVQRALISGVFIAVCCAVLGVFLVLPCIWQKVSEK